MINDETKINEEILKCFFTAGSSRETIKENGIRLFVLLFGKSQPSISNKKGGKRRRKKGRVQRDTSTVEDPLQNQSQQIKLEELRVSAYKDMCAKGKVQPERLPPTEGAVEQHSLRSYLQIQDWMSLECTSLDPKEFGWQRNTPEECYEPIGTTDAIAPDKLLNLISCGCKTGCNHQCSCKKNGIKCMSSCTVCRGSDCANAKQVTAEDDADSDYEDFEDEE